MKITIRAACETDITWFCERLRLYASSIYQTKRAFFQDEGFTHNFMMTLIKEHIVLVAEKDEPVGFIAGILSPQIYDPSLTLLSSCFYWVEPEHRRSRAASYLMEAFVDWGKKSADWICVGLPPQSDVTARTMIRKGFSLKECTYLMEVVQ